MTTPSEPTPDESEFWGEFAFAPGISAEEQQDVIDAVIEARGLQDFQSHGFHRYPDVAPLVITVTCGADHPLSDTEGGPGLAFVFHTSQGPLFTAGVVQPHTTHDDTAPPVLSAAGDGEPQAGAAWQPHRVDQHCYLLRATCPPALPTQCRKHGQRPIPRDQLLAIFDAALRSDTPTPLRVPRERFASP